MMAGQTGWTSTGFIETYLNEETAAEEQINVGLLH